ncbi:hypothetical protein RRG08_011973 [Elysia crispata]|uniref:Uncharacterized protein n=1 Tax=Elysia crispata TaxID=231223 RepID=A0AAE0ZIC9_9GAST|nr:hypothetical protein RRG08_011973 [Elysia crispata]
MHVISLLSLVNAGDDHSDTRTLLYNKLNGQAFISGMPYPSFKSRPLLNGVATGLGPVHAASILWAMDSQSREIERCRP